MKPPPADADLEVADGPPDIAVDFVPNADQTAPVASYQDWNPADTRIVRCRIANDIYPGDRYESRDEAYAATQLKFGRILEANYVPGQAFFRVRRVRTP